HRPPSARSPAAAAGRRALNGNSTKDSAGGWKWRSARLQTQPLNGSLFIGFMSSVKGDGPLCLYFNGRCSKDAYKQAVKTVALCPFSLKL
uniref:Uncharacterized protein n=1 Tax=Salarias fasciatus TaxID=181472 RepID=A0A672G1H7_SALFA